MQPVHYAVSTIALIIYFFLVGISYLGIYTAPAIVLGIVALVIAIALLVRR